MSQPILLDVRPLPPGQRHPKIFEAWNALPVGGALRLVNDHEPKPLYYQFQAERPGEFDWRSITRGPERWEVEIRRIAPARPRGPEIAGSEVRPEWTKRDADLEVDVREDLRQGKEPFGKIMEAVSQCGPEGVLLLRAIFEPKPLYNILRARGFESWTERGAEDDWKVYFRKAGASPEAPIPGISPAPQTHALDVRGLEPPEPMVMILSKLPELGPEDVLEVTHFREPVPLYSHLEEAGFSHEIMKLEEGLYRLRIRRKK